MKRLPPYEAPRIVTPRKPKHTHRPIIAVTDDDLLVERSGMVLPATQLPHVLVTEPSSIIAVQGFGVHLDILQNVFGRGEFFQYRLTPHHKEARQNDDGCKRVATTIVDSVCNFVGFSQLESGDYKSGKRWTRYHYPIDPIHFARFGIDELYPDESTPRLNKLLRFATEVRDWCAQNNLQVKPSAGGLAGQLLRDSRFYPNPRRKAPRLINGIARYRLPGNYYRLRAETQKRFSAAYVDMSNAHHEAARVIQFPNVNTLHGYGRWAEDNPVRGFATGDNNILTRPGLFHVEIEVPHIPHEHFPPPYMQHQAGKRRAWIYSNEIEWIRQLGGRITRVYAAFCADTAETGLNRYAEFAIEQIAAHPNYKPWLKPTLHAAYGILAVRPSRFETGFYKTAGDTLPVDDYPMGRVWLPVRVKRADKETESRTANVIHRGMIEAEVRKQVLQFARQLAAEGCEILAVYADSLFVDAPQLPILPAPWRVSAHCTNLRFYSPTVFLSDQESRMPGIPRSMRDRFREDRLIRRAILIDSALRDHSKPPQRKGHHATC